VLAGVAVLLLAGWTALVVAGALRSDPGALVQLALGPGVGFVLVAMSPHWRHQYASRWMGAATAVAMGFLAISLVIVCLGMIPWSDAPNWGIWGAPPLEEASKALAAFALVWLIPWRQRSPSSRAHWVGCGLMIGIVYAGLEDLQDPAIFMFRALFDRTMSLVHHACFTGITMAGIACLVGGHPGWKRRLAGLVLAVSGVVLHAVNNAWIARLHTWLLFRVDHLPEVVTSEQFFGAPHHDALWYAVGLTWGALVLTLLFGAWRLLQLRSGTSGSGHDPAGTTATALDA
jgi:hypothetical protein